MERFAVNIENKSLDLLSDIALNNGITISWIMRAILLALIQKFPKGLGNQHGICRPRKFENYFRQFSLCFYGDKLRWLLLAKSWRTELDPLLRFGIKLFLQGKLILDFENVKSI